jgi:hypothetical protein
MENTPTPEERPETNEEARADEEVGAGAPSPSGTTEPVAVAPQRSRWADLSERLHAPVSAFAVDLFRLATGLLVVVYYLRLFLEYRDYTSESGFLDHELHRHLFWFSKLTLFYPGSPDVYKLGLLTLGMVGACMLTAGWRPKLGAVLAWVVAVSVHRWNFAVINVDDSSITLLLWWILFLPVGHCLTYRTRFGPLAQGDEIDPRHWRSEVALRVDGFFVRAFFANLFIYYLTAGLTKLWSPLWREGLALYVILKLPLARSNALWDLGDLPAMWVGNHFTLLFEPLFPFLVLLPKGHPVKWVVGASQVLFHLMIPLTIGVPYANLALILGMILVFHGEIEDFWRAKAATEQPVRVLDWRAPRGTRSLIAAYLVTLTLAMSKGIPGVGVTYEPAMATLYWGGVAQEYHLFDWIDRYNWWVENTIEVSPGDGRAAFQAPPTDLFPASVRGFIVQSYLLPMRWMRIPRPLTGEMRNSILRQAAERFVRRHRSTLGEQGTVTVTTRVARLDRDNLDLGSSWTTTLMKFSYDAQGVVSFQSPIMPVGLAQGRP